MLETVVQLERVPPETVMSDSVKFEEGSESVKVRLAVLPALRDVRSELMAMVGGVVSVVVVSIESVSELLLWLPSSLVLPAASEKTPEATEITPSVVLLVLGVKVAV